MVYGRILRGDTPAGLARIIHQPKKPTKEGILGSTMMLKTAVSQEHHNPTNTRIRLCWHCTNRSHSRDQAQCVLAAPSGLQQALRTWVLDALNGAAQDLLGRTHARQQVQTVPQNRRHRARRGKRNRDPLLALLDTGTEFE